MPEPLYVGHQPQLQHIAEELRPRAHNPTVQQPPFLLFYISGPKGSGRRTFVKRLWEEISQTEVPRVLFCVDNPAEGNIARQLLDSCKANRSYLDDALKQIVNEAEGQAKRLDEAGSPLPDDAKITVWSELVEQHLLEDSRNNRGLQLLLVLPELSSMSSDLMESLSQTTPRSNANVDCRIITTGTTKTDLDLIQKIFPDRTPVDEIALQPLTPEDVEQWLHAMQSPTDLTMEVYKRCGGLPVKLENALKEVQQERQERSMMAMAENALGDTKDSLRKNLCLAAMLPEINEQALFTLMLPEDATAVMTNLRQSDWSDSGWREGSFIASAEVRQALVKYLERKYPADYNNALPLASQFARIHAAIPSGKHREYLARLSIFNYFNLEVLREIMPDLANDMANLLKGNPAYFENTGTSFRLKPEIRQAVEAFMKLAKYAVTDSDKARITTAWETRRQKIMDLMHDTEEKVKKEETSLGGLQTQIKQINNSIEKEQSHLFRIRQKSQQRNTRKEQKSDHRGGIRIWRIALEGLGTIIIYISFLLYSRSSLIYAAVGVGLILAGLFVNGRMLSPVREPDVSTPQRADNLDVFERNLKFLNIKKGQLETRQNAIAASIARERTSLKEQDKQLREPYS